jgi:hypothetical protein
MIRRDSSTAILLATACVVVLNGCSVLSPPFDPGLEGREMYLCCTTRFSTGFAASDANYGRYYADKHLYAEGPLLAAGTKVVVTEVRGSGVSFKPPDSPLIYEMNFSYGRDRLTPAEYFARFLLSTDPTTALSASPSLMADIRSGRLAEGMTREQALMARGYPPAHRTPDLTAEEWMYYDTPGFVDRVRFADGKISEIKRGPAP